MSGPPWEADGEGKRNGQVEAVAALAAAAELVDGGDLVDGERGMVVREGKNLCSRGQVSTPIL